MTTDDYLGHPSKALDAFQAVRDDAIRRAMTADDLTARIDAALDGTTPGPWAWRGNVDNGDPRLVGGRTNEHAGRTDVMGHCPSERTADDPGAKSYADYLHNVQILDDGTWRRYTDDEIAERVRDDYLTDQWGEPRTDERLTFCGRLPFHHDARDLVVYEVARNQGLPDDTPRTHPKVYRAEVVDIRHPDARLIAAAPELLRECRDALAEKDAEIADLTASLVELHTAHSGPCCVRDGAQ